MSVTLGDKTKALNRYRETHSWSQAVGRQVSSSFLLLSVLLLVVLGEEYFCLYLWWGEAGQGQQW